MDIFSKMLYLLLAIAVGIVVGTFFIRIVLKEIRDRLTQILATLQGTINVSQRRVIQQKGEPR